MSRFLNELEARDLLSEYKIPMAKSFLIKEKDELAELNEMMDFPVVMKILSPDIQHKTEAGCVFVGVSGDETEGVYEQILVNAEAYDSLAVIDGILVQELAEKGLEIIVGLKRDPQFGPVIMVGTGGIYVEVFKDVAVRLVPLDREEARRMLEETKLCEIVRGARGMQYDEAELLETLLKISALVTDRPDIEEIDINPLFLYEKGKGVKGVDALIKISE